MEKSDIPIQIRRKIYIERHKQKYGQIFIDKMKERSHFHYLKNKEKMSIKYFSVKDTKEYKETKNLQRKRYRDKWKNYIYSILGDKCFKCGFNDRRALQIDHINGDGYLENKKRNATHYRKVYESLERGEKRYQILCCNCNWIKRTENNENAYRKELNVNSICGQT